MSDSVLNTSGLLKLFCLGSKRNTQEVWYMSDWLYYSLQTNNFPLFWSHARKYNIQANEKLTKVKEKWSTNKFDVFVYLFIFFKCHKQKWCVLFLTYVDLVARVLACVYAIPQIKWRRLTFDIVSKIIGKIMLQNPGLVLSTT